MASFASMLSSGIHIKTQILAHGPTPRILSSKRCLTLQHLKNEDTRTKSMSQGLRGRIAGPEKKGGTGGAGVLERPGLDFSTKSTTPNPDAGGEIGKSKDNRGLGGGDRYKVLLLDHERHTETQVAAVLPKVVPSITPEEAKKCFHESRQTGAALVIVTVKEHAEFYAQMMARCGLRSSIEPDGDMQ